MNKNAHIKLNKTKPNRTEQKKKVVEFKANAMDTNIDVENR